MKRTFPFSLTIAVFVCVLSCTHREDDKGFERVVFKAVHADGGASKTALLAEGAVFWTPNDAINLFYGESGASMLTSTNKDTTAQTTFTGVLEGMTPNGTDEFWAVYPYSAGNSFDGSAVTLTLPAQQTGVAGTFADDLFISMARSTDYTLSFYNLCGGVKFSVDTPGIQYVTFRGNDGEMLAGTVKAAFNADGKPQVTEVADGVTQLRLDAPNGGFEVGKWYYMVSLPATLSAGYTMTFYDKDDAVVATRERTASVELKRSIWRRVTSADVTPVSASKYLTFTSEGTTTVSMTIMTLQGYDYLVPTLYYSTDQMTWKRWTFNELTFTADAPLYLCGVNPDGLNSLPTRNHFSTSGDLFSVSGDIMSLVDKDNDLLNIPTEGCFSYLFSECEQLTSGPSLPAITLKRDCYKSLYYHCTNLKSAPELPATTLDAGCYRSMFSGCTALTVAPDLPATSVSSTSYMGMFINCTSLATVPEVLPATVAADSCYLQMFYGCSALTTAPDLPATSLGRACYESMFYNCSNLTSVPQELPAITLSPSCYHWMFRSCTSLTTAPALPATTLTEDCYNCMFYGCSSLTAAPELPATTLAPYCYYAMFSGECTSLTEVPDVLPATTLAESCYQFMFWSCSALTHAPELPATNLAPLCYYSMFERCTSLTTAPQLPATELAEDCYRYMFWSCTNLAEAPELPATTLTKGCYYNMFGNCESLEVAPDLPATELADSCYYIMFTGSANLKYVKSLATNISANGCVDEWLGNVAAEGTFVKSAQMNDWPTGTSGIPEGWTVEDDGTTLISASKYLTFTSEGLTVIGMENVADNAPVLYYSEDMDTWKQWDYDTLHVKSSRPLYFCGNNPNGVSITRSEDIAYSSFTASGDYFSVSGDMMSLLDPNNDLTAMPSTGGFALLFKDCSLLTSAPSLPATVLSDGCYAGLFSGCSSLTSAPALPATEMKAASYIIMFSGCSSLTTAPELPATTLDDSCYSQMFEGCTSLVEAPELPATTLVQVCYSGMFKDCTSLSRIVCKATDISAQSCLVDWVNNVSSQGTFVKATGVQWPEGVSGIPEGWTVVDATD